MALVQALGATLGLVAVIYGITAFLSHSPRQPIASELKFISNDDKNSKNDLPHINDQSSVDLSIVVPCYNEAGRLSVMLDDTLTYLQANTKLSWEILLVDDGSCDKTVAVALEYAEVHKLTGSQFRITQLEQNRGKGGAVTHGVLHSRGKYILFADADGASKFGDVEKLLAATDKLVENPDTESAVAVGSRAYLVNTDAVVTRSFLRNTLMYGFHLLVYFFGVKDIKDTQCGFKMFTRSAAREIFPYMHTERWIFDVEALILAHRKNIPIAEVGVTWHEVEGSKIDLARDSMLMAIDLVVIRFAYMFGIYSSTTRVWNTKAE